MAKSDRTDSPLLAKIHATLSKIDKWGCGLMSALRNRIIVFGLLVMLTLVSSVSLPLAPARAEDDVAKKIFELARKLHYDNVEREGVTYWVGGTVGTNTELESPPGLVVGESMPKFSFSDFYNRSKRLTNKELTPPYMMNFWASWCGPCRVEFPRFTAAIKAKTLSVPLYFVNTGEYGSNDNAQVFLLSFGSPLNTLADVRSRFGRQVGITYIPVTLLVGPDGNVQAVHPGEMNDVALAFFTAIAEHPGVGAFDAKNPDKMPAAKAKK
jgi:thiol-disulfide isomerase/thioredoxin